MRWGLPFSPIQSITFKSLQWATKLLRHLAVKFNFLRLGYISSPFPPKQCWFFYFFDCTDHSTYTTLNWGPGGIRELTLDANKIEQMPKYRKASFPKSVSTTFVTHCSSWYTVIKVFDSLLLCRLVPQNPIVQSRLLMCWNLKSCKSFLTF